MKAARLVVLGIAVIAGLGAALLAGGSSDQPAQPVAQTDAKPLETVEVLVANGAVDLGTALQASDLRWQVWPKEAANAAYVQKDSSPDAQQEWVGAIARSPFVAGEPIRPDKLIKGSGSGYMAAILPAGMRAISIEISAETGAGGFILPNDRVDVILTRKMTGSSGGDRSYSETLTSNTRVLAIDQTVQDSNGQKVVVGKTATLELTPSQAEMIALSRQQGVISLALRSLVDSAPTTEAEARPAAKPDALTIVRFGVASGGQGR